MLERVWRKGNPLTLLVVLLLLLSHQPSFLHPVALGPFVCCCVFFLESKVPSRGSGQGKRMGKEELYFSITFPSLFSGRELIDLNFSRMIRPPPLLPWAPDSITALPLGNESVASARTDTGVSRRGLSEQVCQRFLFAHCQLLHFGLEIMTRIIPYSGESCTPRRRLGSGSHQQYRYPPGPIVQPSAPLGKPKPLVGGDHCMDVRVGL